MVKVIPLVENTTISANYKPEHGLSFYIETEKHKILYDVGPNDLFLHNAKKLNVNIEDIDIVIISHGHSDHGGGLSYFLKNNKKAKIYIRKSAFEPHYIKVAFIPIYIGLDPSLINDERIVFTDDINIIDEELILFSNVKEEHFFSKSNKKLFVKNNGGLMLDDFNHEQSLIITNGSKKILISGCSHSGMINIINKAQEITRSDLDIVIGGFHLFNPPTHKYESSEYIDLVAQSLAKTNCMYYTCHCTGVKAYEMLKLVLLDRINYLSTGSSISIG